jgi:hypothetical protein
MAIVAVSAHLDDAALSASVSLSGVGATVATVFSGMPPPGFGVSYWDRLTGATSSAQRQAERLAEDAVAMGLMAAHARYLDEQEAQYRQVEPDVADLAGAMAELFAGADDVWLPSAIGGHRDHAIARDAGLRAARAAGRADVVLYADFPYVIAYGWPAWVTGQPADPCLDPEFWLADQVAAAGFDPAVMTAGVIRLDAAQRAAKAAIAAAYRTQAAALRLTTEHLAGDPAKQDYELHWRLRLTATAR